MGLFSNCENPMLLVEIVVDLLGGKIDIFSYARQHSICLDAVQTQV